MASSSNDLISLNQKKFKNINVRVGSVAKDLHGEYDEHDYLLSKYKDSDWIPSKLYKNEDIEAVQTKVSKTGIKHYQTNPTERLDKETSSLPKIYTLEGQMYINDGTHRIIASRLNGEKSINVLHLDLDAERD